MKEEKRFVVIDHANKGLGREYVNPNRLAKERAALRFAAELKDSARATRAFKERPESKD